MGCYGQVTSGQMTRNEAEKAFHDTTIGQSLGVSFQPLIQRLFELVVEGGGRLQAAHHLWPEQRGAGDAAVAAAVQVWEVAAGFLYVALIVTPFSVWLYYMFILTDDEKRMESQNASAAANDGDAGGDAEVDINVMEIDDVGGVDGF
jgi:hypothetical protein